MEIKRTKDKNGRVWVYGTGTYEEIEELNIEKNFDAALNVLHFLIKQYGHTSNVKLQMAVNRGICGKRETI